MAQMPTTRRSLIQRVAQEGDPAAWGELYELYGPVVFAFARRRGLAEQDAADLMQEIMLSLPTRIRKYDAGKGRFHSWLFKVADNAALDFHRTRGRDQGSGDSALQARLEQTPDDEAGWQRDWQRRVFDIAAERVRGRTEPSHWEIFWQMTIGDQSGEAVKANLKLDASLATIYRIRERVEDELRQEIAAIQDDIP